MTLLVVHSTNMMCKNDILVVLCTNMIGTNDKFSCPLH